MLARIASESRTYALRCSPRIVRAQRLDRIAYTMRLAVLTGCRA